MTGTEMDLMAKLPNELLVKIFDRLPTLYDQLQVERVSKRFKRCLLMLFNAKPLSLEIDVSQGYDGRVNRSTIRRKKQMLDAVQMLADKAKLNSIDIQICEHVAHNVTRKIDDAGDSLHTEILSIFINSKNQCLDKVTRFQADDFGFGPQFRQVLIKCPRLSSLKLNDHLSSNCIMIPVLKNRALTQLDLELSQCSQKQLIDHFRSPRPNMLQKVGLLCANMTLEPVALINDLRVGSWAELEEIHLRLEWVTVNFVDLFASLRHLPKLRKCNINSMNILSNDHERIQVAPALIALFSSPIEMTWKDDTLVFFGLDDNCNARQTVDAIREVQALHPMLEIGFDINSPALKLSLGHVSVEEQLFFGYPCDDANCADCGSFYHTLLNMLLSMANSGVDVHVDIGSLDRCRVDTVVEDLNARIGDLSFSFLRSAGRALAVEKNDNLAKIKFELTDDHHQFYVTVVCGPCLSYCCAKCIEID